MRHRYYRNAGYRNISVFRLENESEYVLAFQSNLTDNWYYWRSEPQIALGLMQYQTNATRFHTRLEAIREFRQTLVNSGNQFGEFKYQGLEREY